MNKSKKSFAPCLVVMSGPSGSGKTTLCREIAKKLGWFYSISHTTRSQRSNEENGKDYYFITREQFDQMIQKGEFLEWALVYDNYYGTSRQIVEQSLVQGQSVILDVDTQGALKIRALYPKAVLIFVQPPQMETLKNRLAHRGRDSEAEICKRLSQAQHEMQFQKKYDSVLVNDNLEQALHDLEKMIQSKTHSQKT